MATTANKEKGWIVRSPMKGFGALDDVIEPTSDRYVEIAPGLRVLRLREITATNRDLGIEATLEVEYSKRHGRLRVTHVSLRALGNGEITAATWRQVPVTTLISAVVQQWAWMRLPGGEWVRVDQRRLEGEDEEHYVARIYRMASASGFKPSKAVAQALGIAESTAAAKVSLARKLGLLPKTTSGKAKA
jgi:hypothetical protein